MEWLEGDALQVFVERNLQNPAALLNLAEQWVQMAKLLRSAAIGHGDLQHGNVIVTGGQLRLIDYDGMYVPSLAGRQSHEIGHRNYQHPQRSEREFGPEIDHFSTWVVYTSLVALSVQPDLWQTHAGGDECLIFRREDFVQPQSSAVFRGLERSTDARLRSLGHMFQSLAQLPPERVPSIDGVFSVRLPATGTPVTGTPVTGTPVTGTPVTGTPAGVTSDWLRDHLPSAPAPTALAPGAVAAAAANGSGKHPVGVSAPVAQTVGTQQAVPSSENRETNTAVEDPSWIRDFIGGQQATPVTFAGDLRPERAFLQRTAGALVLAWSVVFWFSIPLAVPAAATVAAVLVALGVLAKGYRSDASVQAQTGEWEELHAIDFKARRAARQLKRLQRHEQRLQADHTRRRARVALRLQQGHGAEQADLTRHDQKLQAALAGVQRRRDLLVQSGADTLRKLEAKHAVYLASVDTQIGGLRQLEEADLQDTLKRRQQQFVASYMKRQTIEAAIIPGIGPAAKQALRAHGIVRAQDLEAVRLPQIEGIGDAKARVLLEWRRKAESLALQTAPQSLSKPEEVLIRGRFFQRRFVLEQEKVKAQKRLAKEIAEAKEGNEARLKALDQEPAALRTRAAQQRDELRKRHKAQTAQWQRKLQDLDAQAAPAIAAIGQELTLARQELALLNAQRASIELRLRRYEALGFDNYVLHVLGLA
jgi:hypothetical protein